MGPSNQVQERYIKQTFAGVVKSSLISGGRIAITASYNSVFGKWAERSIGNLTDVSTGYKRVILLKISNPRDGEYDRPTRTLESFLYGVIQLTICYSIYPSNCAVSFTASSCFSPKARHGPINILRITFEACYWKMRPLVGFKWAFQSHLNLINNSSN